MARKKFLFTAEFVKSLDLPSRGSQSDWYSDTKVDGLYIECKPPRQGFKKTERKVFVYRRTVNRSREEKRLGSTAELTVREARLQCAQVARQDELAGATIYRRDIDAPYSIRDMLKWYLDTRDPTSDTPVVDEVRHFKWAEGSHRNYDASNRNYIEPFFGDKHPTELDNFGLIQWEGWMMEQGGESGPRQKALSVLRQAFLAARKRLFFDANHSFPDVTFSHKNVARTAKWSMDEFRRLWNFLAVGKQFTNTAEGKAHELRRATRLLMLTGARKSEITQARWSELERSFNGAAPSLVVHESRQKSRRNHHIVLSSLAQEILQEQYRAYPPAGDDDYVFQSIRSDMALNWSFANQGKFKNTVHDIRRTVATCWGAIGYADKLIELSLGHLPKGVTRKNYNQHEYLIQRHQLMESWTQMLLNAINNNTTTSDGDMWGATSGSVVEALNVSGERQLSTNIQRSRLSLVGAA